MIESSPETEKKPSTKLDAAESKTMKSNASDSAPKTKTINIDQDGASHPNAHIPQHDGKHIGHAVSASPCKGGDFATSSRNRGSASVSSI